MRGRGIGAARGRATIQRGTCSFLLLYILIRRWEAYCGYRRVNSSGVGGNEWVNERVTPECWETTDEIAKGENSGM